MINRAMQSKLDSREAIDISACPRTEEGDYLLSEFHEDKDYCDGAAEQWIWSIGKLLTEQPVRMRDGSVRTLPVGTYLASQTSKFYSMCMSEDVECVFLR